MTAVGWLPASAEDIFGPQARAEESYDVLTVDVPPAGWAEALRIARDELGCTFFDWLSAVDEPGTGFRVTAHVVALSPVRRLLFRTTLPHGTPVLPSAVGIYAGAAWHERETHEMFGVTFEGHPGLDHLLLPEGFEGHPLRKDFVLAARVAKAWPGAKEPGESDHGGPRRRQMLPPGVPDPNEWGPLKGQLPPAPTRPARAVSRPAGERPVRRTRTAAEGSTSQAPAAPEPTEPPAPRRARSASEGSASQRASEGTDPAAAPPAARRARSVFEGSVTQRAEAPAADGAAPEPRVTPRGPDAPWHHARPAFEEPGPEPAPEPSAEPGSEPAPEPSVEPEPGSAEGGTVPAAEPDATGGPARSDDAHPGQGQPGGAQQAPKAPNSSDPPGGTR